MIHIYFDSQLEAQQYASRHNLKWFTSHVHGVLMYSVRDYPTQS